MWPQTKPLGCADSHSPTGESASSTTSPATPINRTWLTLCTFWQDLFYLGYRHSIVFILSACLMQNRLEKNVSILLWREKEKPNYYYKPIALAAKTEASHPESRLQHRNKHVQLHEDQGHPHAHGHPRMGCAVCTSAHLLLSTLSLGVVSGIYHHLDLKPGDSLTVTPAWVADPV